MAGDPRRPKLEAEYVGDADESPKCRVRVGGAEQAADDNFVRMCATSELRLRQPQGAAPFIELAQDPIDGGDARVCPLVCSPESGIPKIALEIPFKG